jgi:CubicO group peptidase (beta-lactamase class C family)
MTNVDFARPWPEPLDRLDRHGSRGLPSPDVATLAELMRTSRVPGVSIAVGRADGQLWSAGYGTTGAAPVHAGTAFQACSISKHVAAVGTVRLVGEGVLELDADIHDYLTSWRLPGAESGRAGVTLRQLLAHTAGLSANWFRGYGAGEAVPSMLQTLNGEAPANTPPVRLSLLPGSRFRYSGSHYAVLQQLLVDVTGSPFDELLHALVLAPVGMGDSSFDQGFPLRRPRAVASGHHTGGTTLPGGWRRIPEQAGAGLWSTPTDLVRLELELARAVAGGSALLGAEQAAELVTPQLPGGGYGLGTEVDAEAGRFGHTGLSVGYTCFSFAWPGAGAAVAVMTNSDDGGDILTSVIAAADRLYSRAGKAAPPDDVTGRYLLRDDFPIDITAADGRLTFAAPGRPPVALSPLENGHHRHPGLDLELRFPRPGVLEVRQEGHTQIATR